MCLGGREDLDSNEGAQDQPQASKEKSDGRKRGKKIQGAERKGDCSALNADAWRLQRGQMRSDKLIARVPGIRGILGTAAEQDVPVSSPSQAGQARRRRVRRGPSEVVWFVSLAH